MIHPDNAENIIDTLNEISAIQSGAAAFLRAYDETDSKVVKAAKYIASGKWQENPALIASYGELYKRFLKKLPEGRLYDSQIIKALEWFYERLYSKWNIGRGA